MNIKALQQKKADLVKEAKYLLNDAETNEDGKLTKAQDTKYNDLMAQIETVDANLEKANKLADLERSMDAVAPAAEKEKNDLSLANAQLGRNLQAAKPFESFSEQLNAIVTAATPGGQVDPRLTAGATAAGAGERVPSDGGFLVQQDFARDIVMHSYNIGAISSRVRRVPISSGANGLKMNAIDETSRVNGSRFGGVQMYWEGEGDAPTAKKPKFRQMELKLKKLIGLMYATDELLSDAVAFDSVARQAFAQELNFMVEASILEGNGAGQPKGIFNSNALVTIAKEDSQEAATIVYENIVKMWSRCWGRSRQNAVWLINQDIEPQLFTLSQEIGQGGVALYQPANGAADAPFSTLFGRPVIPVEHAATLGDVNDISLVDLSQYLMIDKGAPKQDVSIHVRFIYDESAFRIVYRCDGQPIWESALTPKKGSNTLSPFVNLATRS